MGCERHSNHMGTNMARNVITGDSIANTKGSAEKYAQGWERLFGKKAKALPSFSCQCTRCGQITEVKELNVSWACIGCGENCGIFTGGY